MPVSRRAVKGVRMWVIDRRFRGPDGQEERYRRVAQVQARSAAEAEERRIADYWAAYGTIKPLLSALKAAKVEAAEPPKVHVWEDAVRHYERVELPKKKPSTRHGYKGVLSGPGFRRWAGIALTEITRAAITEWDTELIKTGMGASTRRNQHIVLRAVLRSVGPDEKGLLHALPSFPRLPQVGEAPVLAVRAEDLRALLAEGSTGQIRGCQIKAVKAAQLAFAVAAYSGLRAGEVRALRRRDVDLEGRTLTVRAARSVGEETSPKNGDAREVPLADALHRRLEERCRGLEPDHHVCVMASGKPWGDQGMLAALHRACKRLKIPNSRYHGLRHYFATTVFRGTDARTVQGLLGHSSLAVTQRYAHFDADRAREAVSIFV